MIKTIEYTKDKARTIDFSKVKLDHTQVAQRTFHWSDFLDPSDEDLRTLAKDSDFLMTDLKKCLDESARSRLIQRNNYTLILFKAISDENKIVTVGLFFTKKSLVTVHKAGIKALVSIQASTLSEKPITIIKSGINYLLHQILQEIEMDYFRLFDEVEREMDKLEEKLFKKTRANIMHETFTIKKIMIYSKQALNANRETLNELEKVFQSNPTDKELIHHLFNEITQLIDENTLYHERLTGVIDAHLTKQSNDLNEVMKSFTVIASLILLPTLVAGAYGMNLVLPLGDHPQGFWILLGVMALVVTLMFLFFKKKGWV